jgi:hypothetical protein
MSLIVTPCGDAWSRSFLAHRNAEDVRFVLFSFAVGALSTSLVKKLFDVSLRLPSSLLGIDSGHVDLYHETRRRDYGARLGYARRYRRRHLRLASSRLPAAIRRVIIKPGPSYRQRAPTCHLLRQDAVFDLLLRLVIIVFAPPHRQQRQAPRRRDLRRRAASCSRTWRSVHG